MIYVLSAISFVRSFMRKLRDDYINAFSAQAAFFIIISFFPFVMFLLTLVQYLPIKQSELLRLCNNLLPGSIMNSFITSIILEIYSKATGTIMSITIITTLWSASRGFLSIERGFHSVYAIKETRNYVKLRLISAIYTLIFAVFIVVTLAIFVFGNQIYLSVIAKFPLLNDLALLVISLRTAVGLFMLTLFFLMLYIFVPNRKTTWIAELPGALLSAGGWMGFSYLYSLYIDHMGSYSYTYGSLTAVVLLMLWLYFCMYIVFVGAEINMLFSGNDVIRMLKGNKDKKDV